MTLDPKLAGALAYVLGPVSGVIFLVVEKEDSFVRFHAMQSVVTFVGIAIAHLVVRNLPVLSWILVVPFFIGTVVLWAWLIAKAFMGERYKLPYVADLAERLLSTSR